MAVALSSNDLLRLKDSLDASLRLSKLQYEQLRAKLQEKDPTITQERIEAVKNQWIASGIKPSPQEASFAAVSAARYELAYKAGALCFQALSPKQATAQAVVDAQTNGGALWRAIAGLAIALNGAPIAQDFFDAGLETLHQRDPVLIDLQRTLDDEYARQSKRGGPIETPSQRELATLAGKDRKTVSTRWAFLRFLQSPKKKK